MTEDQIRAAVRAEIEPFRKEVNERFDVLGNRLTVASDDRREMLRILRTLAPEEKRVGANGPVQAVRSS